MCFLELTPAVTDIAGMLQIVGAHPMFTSLTRKESTAASGSEYQLSDQYQNIVIVLDTRNVVQNIHWQNRDCASRWRSTVGDVVNILGQPVAVQSFGLAPTTYIYLNFQIAIESNRGGTLVGCRSQNNADRLDPHYVV